MYESVIKELAQLALSHRPEGLAKIEIEYKWFGNGDQLGPGLRYLDKAGNDLGNRIEVGKYRALSELFYSNQHGLRIQHMAEEPHSIANLFRMNVATDGTASYELIHDSTLDEKREREVRESLGDELYAKLKAEDQERATRVAPAEEPPPPAQPRKELSIPQLLGAIYEETAGSAPPNWQTVEVEGKVWTEDGKQAVKVQCHYSLSDNPERHALMPSQHLPVMNALLQLNRAMATQGDTWTTIMLKFTANDPNTLVDWC